MCKNLAWTNVSLPLDVIPLKLKQNGERGPNNYLEVRRRAGLYVLLGALNGSALANLL